jgi:hypothetical protein
VASAHVIIARVAMGLQGEVGDGEHLREGQGGVWVEDGDAGGRGGAERPPRMT